MPIKKGFTVIELMVVIAVLGILASVTAPSFLKGRRDQRFLEETQIFFDLISEARTNAFAGKKCSNDTDGDTDNNLIGNWGVWINSTGISPNGPEFRLFCVESVKTFDSSIDFDIITEGEAQHFYIDTIVEIKTKKDSTWYNSTLSSGGILFLAGSSQARFFDYDGNSIDTNTFNSYEYSSNLQRYIKINFTYPDSKNEKTICLDRIAGFPTMSDTGNCADEEYQ